MRAARKLSGAGMAAVLVVLAIVLALLHFRAYFSAPGTHDLTDTQRTGAIRNALKRGGVAALRERGDMDILRREDVAQIGNSRCIGEHECARTSTRRIPHRCAEVQTVLHCAYEIVDKQGNTAAALVNVQARPGHASRPLARRVRLALRDDVDRAARCDGGEGEVQMGYCEPGALARWKPPPRVEPPDPDAEARRRCNGVLADIVGQGKTCLDPDDPAAREFRDCDARFCGPPMVALPKGRYMRGTSDDEAETLIGEYAAVKDWLSAERPAREVTIDYHLAVGKFEVTFDDWDACLQDAHCPALPSSDDEGSGRGRRPVISVSWNDITRHYLPWLNGKLRLSGSNAYRLLSDAEWEYAARAGTTTRYGFGDAISKTDARYHDDRSKRRTA